MAKEKQNNTSVECARNIRIAMEHNNIVSNRLKKLIDILTLLK